MSKNGIKAIEMQSLDVSTLVGAAFSPIGVGLPHACFMLRIDNDSDINLVISYDGVTEHDFLHAGSTEVLFGFPQAPNMSATMAEHTVIYAANSTGGAGTGDVYVIGYYQDKG
jgi:hypothetical protein